MKTLKNGKKLAIKFDRKCKNAEHRYHQQIYYKPRNGGAIQYLLIIDHFSQISFHKPPPQLFLSINCILIDYSV